jgi:hypothetical protein
MDTLLGVWDLSWALKAQACYGQLCKTCMHKRIGLCVCLPPRWIVETIEYLDTQVYINIIMRAINLDIVVFPFAWKTKRSVSNVGWRKWRFSTWLPHRLPVSFCPTPFRGASRNWSSKWLSDPQLTFLEPFLPARSQIKENSQNSLQFETHHGGRTQSWRQ